MRRCPKCQRAIDAAIDAPAQVGLCDPCYYGTRLDSTVLVLLVGIGLLFTAAVLVFRGFP